MTNDIARRAFERREGLVEGFTRRYGLNTLVYVERHDGFRTVIQRATALNHWPRV